MAAPSLRGFTSARGAAGSSSINSGSWSAAPQAGDLIVALVVCRDPSNSDIGGGIGDLTVSSGWTKQTDTIINMLSTPSSDSSCGYAAVYTRTATGNSSDNLSVTDAGGTVVGVNIYAAAFSGADTSSPLRHLSLTPYTATTPLVAVGGTAVTDDVILTGFATSRTGGADATIATPSGMTSLNSAYVGAAFSRIGMQRQTVTSDGATGNKSSTPSGTWTTDDDMAFAMLALIKPAGATIPSGTASASATATAAPAGLKAGRGTASRSATASAASAGLKAGRGTGAGTVTASAAAVGHAAGVSRIDVAASATAAAVGHKAGAGTGTASVTATGASVGLKAATGSSTVAVVAGIAPAGRKAAIGTAAGALTAAASAGARGEGPVGVTVLRPDATWAGTEPYLRLPRTVKVGDLEPVLLVELLDGLTPLRIDDAAQATLVLRRRGGASVLTYAATIVDNGSPTTRGLVRVIADADLTARPGILDVEVELEWSLGRAETFPPDRALQLVVTDDLR
jgi:hypothetical protein